MNERIEKLGEQADLLGEFTPTKIPGRYVGYITEEQILKFAELIVSDCLDIVDENVSGMVGVNAMKKIEEHFGMRIE